MSGPDPTDPADEREWQIHRAFEKKDKEIAALRAEVEHHRDAYLEEARLHDALRSRCAGVDGLAEALFGNEMLYSDYDAESRTGPVPKLWKDVSEGDRGYFREIALTVVAYLKEG